MSLSFIQMKSKSHQNNCLKAEGIFKNENSPSAFIV